MKKWENTRSTGIKRGRCLSNSEITGHQNRENQKWDDGDIRLEKISSKKPEILREKILKIKNHKPGWMAFFGEERRCSTRYSAVCTSSDRTVNFCCLHFSTETKFFQKDQSFSQYS